MPDKSTIEKAKKDKEENKSGSTQAGEFVHDEIEKVKKENMVYVPLSRQLLPGYQKPAGPA